MAENVTETIIGGLVLAVAGGFAYFASGTTFTAATSGEYALMASFRSAEGISVGTEVRLAGVAIGSVKTITLNTDTYRAEVEIGIQEGLKFSDDTQILVSSEGILGGSFVEIVPGGSPDDLGAGDEIEDTQGSVSFINLLAKYVGGRDK